MLKTSCVDVGSCDGLATRFWGGVSRVSVSGSVSVQTGPHSGELHGAAVLRRAAARVAKRR